MQKIDFEKRELIKKYTTQINSKTLIKKSVTQKIQSAFRFNLQQKCSLERIFPQFSKIPLPATALLQS